MDASDERQRLDDDLASGRLDATTYRRRRDELTARRREDEAAARAAATEAPASGDDPTGPEGDPAPTPPVPDAPPPPVAPEPSPDRPGAQERRPGPDPFPPPFRWGDPEPATTPPAEVTQVVERSGEDTQVVPDPPRPASPAVPPRPAGPPPTPPRGGPPPGFRPPSFPPPPERTQVVPGALAGRRPSPPVPAAHTTPPWVETGPDRTDRPPPGMQGSEVFLGRRRDLASVLGTAAVVLVVIAILVVSFTLG